MELHKGSRVVDIEDNRGRGTVLAASDGFVAVRDDDDGEVGVWPVGTVALVVEDVTTPEGGLGDVWRILEVLVMLGVEVDQAVQDSRADLLARVGVDPDEWAWPVSDERHEASVMHNAREAAAMLRTLGGELHERAAEELARMATPAGGLVR